MDEVLFGVLAEHVDDCLATADRECRAEDVRRLVAAWRAVLAVHHPTGRGGRCAGCGRRFGRGRSGAGRCDVWRVATAFFGAGRP